MSHGLSSLTRWHHLVAEVNGRRGVGMAGVRDLNEQDNCDEFAPDGSRTNDCDSDGHYMCLECVHCDVEQYHLLKKDG